MLKAVKWMSVIILVLAVIGLAGLLLHHRLADHNTADSPSSGTGSFSDIGPPSDTGTSSDTGQSSDTGTSSDTRPALDLSRIPEYDGSPYVLIDDNRPSFSEKEMSTESFEHYSSLDRLGRCGTAYANLGPETLPEEERGPIGEIHPSGWQIANYHELIDGNYLYNRCHLIAFSLSGENANEQNLITGTRYLNTEGMQPFELEVLDYIRRTGNHVLYRVTPHFKENDLLAAGVEMEALSVEDHGKGISYHIFAYNVQPGIIIDYSNGDNYPDPGEKAPTKEPAETGSPQESYVLNTNTRKFHYPSCPSVDDIKEKNKKISNQTRDQILEEGYEPCGRCLP